MSQDVSACPHGLAFGSSGLAGIMWAGPIGTCRCHHGMFGYIDSGEWSESGSRTITNDPDLCPDCGGKAVETLTGSGEYSFMPGGEDRWYRRTWYTDAEGNIHDETVPAESPVDGLLKEPASGLHVWEDPGCCRWWALMFPIQPSGIGRFHLSARRGAVGVP